MTYESSTMYDLPQETPEEEAEHLAALAKYREEREELIARIEQRFTKQKLKFTVPFTGNIPNIALGDYKGMRFEFRFRGDYARLSVGKFNLKKAEDEYLKELFAWRSSTDEDWKEFSKPHRPITEGTHLRANEILYVSEKENVTGDRLASDLTWEQAEELFIELVKNLKKV
jgi:hypothetical protein